MRSLLVQSVPVLFIEIQAANPRTSSNASAPVWTSKMQNLNVALKTGWGPSLLVKYHLIEVLKCSSNTLYESVKWWLKCCSSRFGCSLEVLLDYAVPSFLTITTLFFLSLMLWLGAYRLLNIFFDVYLFVSQAVICHVQTAQHNHYRWKRTTKFSWYLQKRWLSCIAKGNCCKIFSIWDLTYKIIRSVRMANEIIELYFPSVP